MRYIYFLASCFQFVTLNAQTAVPVAGMAIRLQDASNPALSYMTLTDMQGMAQFEQVPAGEYSLLVDLDGNQVPFRNDAGQVQRFIMPSSTNSVSLADRHFLIPIPTGNLKAKVGQSGQQLQVQLQHQPDKR